jgi:signal transduction histidine kinase
MERLPLAIWLRRIAADFGRGLPEGDSTVAVQLPPMLPDIQADPDAMACAIQNLLDNAVKYSPAGATVRLGAEATPGGVTITVQDEGVGISPADGARVFEMFERGASAATRHVKGAGLGLSLVRHIVAAHGGRVTFESRNGAGTTFFVHLPAEATRLREPHVPSESAT